MAHAAQAISNGSAPALPAHVAIIMDGNGRWADARGIARMRGHSQGAEALRTLLDSCRARPFIRHLTLYAFSLENWNRPATEVEDLMNLLRHYVKREAAILHENNVRMQFIGELETLAPDIQRDLESVRTLTQNNTGLTVNMAISYGSRQEMVTAMKRIAIKIADGELKSDAITPEVISAHLHTAGTPDPDLLIRTGGDERISNFLLWQSAYTEFYFIETLWPDFTPTDLDAAIESFSQRERRFGKRKEA
jgi:undecaprenyl diphosphate synthase